YFDGCHSGVVAGDRRDGSADSHRRAGLRALRCTFAPGRVYGASHADIQLDLPPAGGVPCQRRRRNHYLAGDNFLHERDRGVSAEPLAKEDQLVTYETDRCGRCKCVLWGQPCVEEHLLEHQREYGHRFYRPLWVWKNDFPAHIEPDERLHRLISRRG